MKLKLLAVIAAFALAAPASELTVAKIEDQVVDGVNPCAPTLSVTDAEGNPLSEGVDYDVVWPDLAAPGAATVFAAYTWNSKVTEGAWSDAGNWTITKRDAANPSESWPQREEYHAAAVPDCWTGVVEVAGGEECLYVRAGKNSRATLPGAGGATLEFSPAKAGWEQAALSVTKDVCLDGAAGVATVTMVDDAPVWKSMKKVDFALIDSVGGINTNAFKIVAPSRSNGELYWHPADVESPTQLRFRMSPPGLLLIIR